MAEIKIGKIVIGSGLTNCYFVYREGSGRCVFFDPADQGKYLYDKMTEAGFAIDAILLTHGHYDHITGADALREASGAKIYAMEAERVLLEDAYVNISAQMHRPVTLTADGWLHDGDALRYGDLSCEVIATPGHTVGGCCYYFAEGGICVCGDTIFAESIGRTDFPTGSMKRLIASVQERIFTLPDETRLYPGHGPATTVGHEKAHNPFFAE